MQASQGPTGVDDAVAVSAYLDRVSDSLAPFDFAPERTFAAVSICRDELTQPLIGDIAKRWDHPFHLGGLGGLPSLGRTGWGACLSHVPDRGGRGHLLVFGFPHIGIAPDHSLGSTLRRHQDSATPTCGALTSILETFEKDPGAAGVSEPGGELADAEATRLRQLVSAKLERAPAGLLELTFAAAAAVRDEMWAQLDALEPWSRTDVAVFTGIQIHVPGESDRILALTAELRSGDGPACTLAGAADVQQDRPR